MSSTFMRCAFVFLLLSRAAFGQTEPELVAPAERAQDARQRNSQAAPDPWTVSTPAQLFSRPTFGEVFKLSAQGTGDGLTMGAAISLAPLLGHPQWTRGLQAAGSYTPQLASGDVGLKWNVTLPDWKKVKDAGEATLSECRAPYLRSGDGTVPNEAIDSCNQAAHDARLKALADQGPPSFSLGAAMTLHRGLQEIKANLSFEKPFGTLSVVANADLDVTLSQDFTYGGGAAVAWRPAWFEQQLELSAGAKVVSCKGATCVTPGVSVELGPTASVLIEKDTVLAASLTVRGVGATLPEAVGALAISHSFGLR